MVVCLKQLSLEPIWYSQQIVIILKLKQYVVKNAWLKKSKQKKTHQQQMKLKCLSKIMHEGDWGWVGMDSLLSYLQERNLYKG